jgi:hypothetical protein
MKRLRYYVSDTASQTKRLEYGATATAYLKDALPATLHLGSLI